MIKVEVVEEFNLKAFGELKNIERFNPMKKEKGKLYLRDTFECSKEMCEYLTGSNPLNKVVVKVIEVEPKVESFILLYFNKRSKKSLIEIEGTFFNINNKIFLLDEIL